MSTHPTQLTPLEKAWTDFVEKVGIAGWREAFSEKVFWIRLIFRLCLLLVTVVCFINIVASVRSSLRSGYKDDISDYIDLQSLPMSNVSVCAQVLSNRTFVKTNVTIPEKMRRMIRQRTGYTMKEIWTQLTYYLSFSLRSRRFTTAMWSGFQKIVRANPQINDYSEFLRVAVPSCRQMLRRCWFDGRPFDCCRRAVQSMDDDGVCYVVMANFDSNNALPDPRTLHQTRPGPEGGLVIEASLSTRHYPMLESDAQNGFKIIVGPTPITVLESPSTAAHTAETYIRINPSKRIWIDRCVSSKNLSMPGGEYMYYDPEGLSFFVRRIARAIEEILGCDIIFYLRRPNASDVCRPNQNLIATTFMGAEDLGELVRPWGLAGLQYLAKFERMLAEATGSIWERRPHCQYWTYGMTTSFHYLEPRQPLPKDVMYSKIRVYYSELSYRQHSQVEEIPAYLAFCNFGNVLVLYWGMSIAGVFHLLVYVPRYVYFWSKRSRETKSLRKRLEKQWTIMVRSSRVLPVNDGNVF